MKTPAVILFLALAGLCSAQKPTVDLKAEQAVRGAMNDFAKAVLAKDKLTLEKVMSDTVMYSHSNGNLDTKADFINNVMTENPKYEAVDYGDQKIVLYGNTAVVRGKMTVKDHRRDGSNNTLELNVMQTWIKSGSGWTMVGRQATRLNP